ncbi:hypothetical protein ACTFIW_000950 [Dictyostelium discoideum]
MFIQPQKDNGLTCQTRFQVSMKLLVPKEKKKSVIKEIRNFLNLDCCSPRKLVGLKGKLIALKNSVILFRLYTRRTNKFHSQCLTRQWRLGSIIPHSSRCQFRDFMLVDSSKPSNEQLLNNQNECTPSRLESMEAMSGLPTTHSFAFYRGEIEFIQFEEGFYNTDLPNLETSNLVSDDSRSSSSSSSSHVSSSTGIIPRSIDQTISRINTNPNLTTLETGDYSTFQSHVMSIIRIQKSSTAELLMKYWEPSTLKVYSSSYTRFHSFSNLRINIVR